MGLLLEIFEEIIRREESSAGAELDRVSQSRALLCQAQQRHFRDQWDDVVNQLTKLRPGDL